MEWLKCSQIGIDSLKKYRIVILAVCTGLLLLWIPGKEKQPAAVSQEAVMPQDLETSLRDILSKVHGAGKVEVLLTEKKGAEILYHTDVEVSRSENTEHKQSNTVMAQDSSRAEEGLIRQTNPPVLQGALIVCQGGDDPRVKLAIVEAVTRVTGLPSSCVSVLKMK